MFLKIIKLNIKKVLKKELIVLQGNRTDIWWRKKPEVNQ